MNRYKESKLVILARGLHTEGGDWRSVYFLARHLETAGEKVALVNPSGKRGLRQSLASALFAPNIILNGLGTLAGWLGLSLCLARKDIAVYLHETEYALNQFQRESPFRYKLVSEILRRNPLLCVSEQAESLYRERFGSRKTTVVYECPGYADQKAVIDASRTNIVMVGSINERKGVELFSKIADQASTKHPDWCFHWVGALSTMNEIYRSPKVTWHGWQWQPNQILERCDLYFLSSVDDPCPLSALEAMGAGLRIVAYKKTGTAEIIRGVPGCNVYEEHTIESALASIELALTDPSGPSLIQEKYQQIAGTKAFANRVLQAFGQTWA